MVDHQLNSAQIFIAIYSIIEYGSTLYIGMSRPEVGGALIFGKSEALKLLLERKIELF